MKELEWLRLNGFVVVYMEDHFEFERSLFGIQRKDRFYRNMAKLVKQETISSIVKRV